MYLADAQSWLMVIFALLTIILFADKLLAFDLTVIQTGDLHSHFTNNDDPLHLGGLARVMTQVNKIRSENKNTLFLDAGDWSEGTLFFTIDSGEETQRILSSMHYDAMVLGNHDWLVGAKALYESFAGSHFQTPVVSANLNLNGLPSEIPLKNYIKPYIVKEINGVRVGIFGLSTFELIYDDYFRPVRLKEPYGTAKYYVDVLRKKENCQIVIALSHLGIDQDKLVGKFVSGIDLIAGGHTHVLLEKPAYGGSTPITHTGFWGRYVGETHLEFNGSKTALTSYQVHQINQNIEEDPEMKSLIDGSIKKLEAQMGNVFNDHVLQSEVDLPAQDMYLRESALGNWAADTYAKIGHADLAFDFASFRSRDLFRGTSNSADIFNVFPHVFNRETQRTWTIKTFDVSGKVLKYIFYILEKVGTVFDLSNSHIVVDQATKDVKDIQIDGAPLDDNRRYVVATNDGFATGLESLRRFNITLGIRNPTDTGVETWRAVAQTLISKSPITAKLTAWQGRIRSVQPDLMVRGEDTWLRSKDASSVTMAFVVHNAGLAAAAASTANVKLITSPETEGPQRALFTKTFFIPSLDGGRNQAYEVQLPTQNLKRGLYPVDLSVGVVAGEANTDNNSYQTVIDLN